MNDDDMFLGSIEVQKSTNSIHIEPNLTISIGELSATPSKNEKEEIALNSDIANCSLYLALLQSPIIDTSNISTIEETIKKDLTIKSMQTNSSNGLKCANETLINNAHQMQSNTKSSLFANTLTKEVDINARIQLESTTKISALVEPPLEAKKKSIMMNATIKPDDR